MEILLHFKGTPMGFPLDSYGIYMVFCMIVQRDFYGISMGFKMDFYGIPMGVLWHSYGISMICLWYFYGIALGLQWKVSLNQFNIN